MGNAESINDQSVSEEDECEEGNGLDELLTVQPPERLKGASIIVSKKVCDYCSQFIEKVNNEFGLILVADCSVWVA